MASLSTYSTVVGLKLLAKRFGTFNNLIRLPSSLISGTPIVLFRSSELIAQNPAVQAGRFECTRYSSISEYIDEVESTLSDLRFEMTFASPYQYNMFLNKISAMDRILADSSLQTFDSTMRRQPYGVIIKGVPGGGKSSLAYKLAQKMCAATGRPLHPTEMVVLNESDEFQSEFRSYHRVVIFDDIAAEFKDVATVNPWRKVIDFINNIPKTSLNPHLELKGNILIRPEIVIVTSNVNELRQSSGDFVICPEAIARRFPDSITIDYKGDSMHEVYRVNRSEAATMNKRNHENLYSYHCCEDYNLPIGKLPSRDMIIDNIAAKYKLHDEVQKEFIETVNSGFKNSFTSCHNSSSNTNKSSWIYKPSTWFARDDDRKINFAFKKRMFNTVSNLSIPLKLCRAELNEVNLPDYEQLFHQARLRDRELNTAKARIDQMKDQVKKLNAQVKQLRNDLKQEQNNFRNFKVARPVNQTKLINRVTELEVAQKELESKNKRLVERNKNLQNTIDQLRDRPPVPTLSRIVSQAAQICNDNVDIGYSMDYIRDLKICYKVITEEYPDATDVYKHAMLLLVLQKLIKHLDDQNFSNPSTGSVTSGTVLTQFTESVTSLVNTIYPESALNSSPEIQLIELYPESASYRKPITLELLNNEIDYLERNLLGREASPDVSNIIAYLNYLLAMRKRRFPNFDVEDTKEIKYRAESLYIDYDDEASSSDAETAKTNNCIDCDICSIIEEQIKNDELLERIGKHGFFKHLLSENPVSSYLESHQSSRMNKIDHSFLYVFGPSNLKGIWFTVHDNTIEIQHNLSKTMFKKSLIVKDIIRLSNFANFFYRIIFDNNIMLSSSAARTGTPFEFNETYVS